MAIVKKQIGFEIDIDEEAIAPMSVEVWIYRFLNDLGNEHEIKSVTVDGVTAEIKNREDLYDLPLGEDKPLT